MGVEAGVEAPELERWAAFLTYAHEDDDALYIESFYEIFVKELISHDIKARVFLDKSEDTKYGDVENYFRQHASMADFLIIFVGNHYPRRRFCLFEWSAFRSQFHIKDEAKERLCIIEIDDGAIDRLAKESQEEDVIKRASEVISCFQEKRLIECGRRVPSKIGGNPNEEFIETVKQIARGFAKKYRELQQRPPKRAAPYSVSESAGGPLPEPDIDVVIAASTPDLESAVVKLTDELDSLKRKTQRIDAHDLPNLTDRELCAKLRSGKWLVQPFSWHKVTNARTPGGHLVRQVSLFDRAERALFWRPDDGLDKDGASGDLAANVEDRREHIETLEALHSGRSPVPGGYSVILGEAAKVIERIAARHEPLHPDGRVPRILWERDEKVADRLDLAVQFTEEHCAAKHYRVRNIIFELKQLLEETSEWPKDAHGLVLADYAKSGKELWENINKVYDAFDVTGRDIPIIVGVIDKRQSPRVDKPPSIFFTMRNDAKRVSVEGEVLEKFDGFLRKACELALSDAEA